MKNFPLILLVFLIGLASIGPMLVPYSPFEFSLEQMAATPNEHHWLGFDESGRDILSRLMWGARYSLGIALVVTFLSSVFGVIVGFLAGFYRRWVEKIFLLVADVFQSFPGILLAIALAAFVTPGVSNIIFLLSFVGWVGYARVSRAQVLSLREKEFIESLRASGIPVWRMFLFHFLPNMAGPLLIQASFGMAGVILTESTLSFLGLGLPVDAPSFGRMLDGGSQYLLVAPHISLFPGLFIFLCVMTFNLLGDQLRDKLARE